MAEEVLEHHPASLAVLVILQTHHHHKVITAVQVVLILLPLEEAVEVVGQVRLGLMLLLVVLLVEMAVTDLHLQYLEHP